MPKLVLSTAFTLFLFCGALVSAQTGILDNIAASRGSVAGTTAGTTTADNTLTADVLSKSLYAKTSEEIEYCEFVIRMRDEKVLPNRILYYAYNKATAQAENSRRFIYFQTVLELACDKQGIVLESANATKLKNFFGFSFTKTKASAPKVASPGKPFAFFHKIFTQ